MRRAKEILDEYSMEALLNWAERIRQEGPWKERTDLRLAEVIDATPAIIEALSAALESGDPAEFFQQHPEAVERAQQHARTRRAQGFPLAAAIREYSILRDEVWATIWRHYAGPIQRGDMYPLIRAIAGTLDAIVEASIQVYTEEREAA